MHQLFRTPALIVLACVVLSAFGCGKPLMVKVTGTVSFKGKPLKGCKVGFSPATSDFDPERHGYGFGITNEQGQFEIQHPSGTPGIFPGTYKVTFVAWVNNKGEPIAPDAKPSEVPGGVKNLLPSKYESIADTPETVTVPKSGANLTFNLTE